MVPAMKQSARFVASLLVLSAAIEFASPVRADFEVTGPDGRRILLKDDGTWGYLTETTLGAATDGEAVLVLERMTPRGNGCQLAMRLENKLPYEIRSLVPYYSVFRAGGTLYDTSSGAQGFGPIKPGDSQSREIEFQGISCSSISRVQVGGGGRCQMGDLDRFSATPQQCLARVRVVESNLVRFDK